MLVQSQVTCNTCKQHILVWKATTTLCKPVYATRSILTERNEHLFKFHIILCHTSKFCFIRKFNRTCWGSCQEVKHTAYSVTYDQKPGWCSNLIITRMVPRSKLSRQTCIEIGAGIETEILDRFLPSIYSNKHRLNISHNFKKNTLTVIRYNCSTNSFQRDLKSPHLVVSV